MFRLQAEACGVSQFVFCTIDYRDGRMSGTGVISWSDERYMQNFNRKF